MTRHAIAWAARATAAGAFALLAQPQLAAADHCGGGGGGGGSGGGSHGGSDMSFRGASSGTVVVDPPCEDASDVVGFRQCTKFGAWGANLRVPHITIEGGVAVRQSASLLGNQTGSFMHGPEPFVYRVVAPTRDRPIDTAVLSTVRASVGVSHGIYTALEVDFGALAQPGRAETEMMSTGARGTPELQQQRGFVVDSLATLGIRGAGRAGGLGVELSGGMRAVSYSFHSTYLACEQDTSIRAFGPIAEARARGELWVSPWLTAGVTVGTSLLEQRTWTGGLYLGVHTRAFGGDR
jgi:hypothetical protein